MKLLTTILFIVSLPLLLSAQLDTAHLEPSASLGGRGKAAPYVPQSSHMPDHHFTSGIGSAAPFPNHSTKTTGPNLNVTADGPADWVAEAVHYYPELSIKDSPLNKAFLSVYQRTKATKPDLLTKPHWPLGLAIAARAMLDTNISTQQNESTASKIILKPPLEAGEEKPEAATTPGLTETVTVPPSPAITTGNDAGEYVRARPVEPVLSTPTQTPDIATAGDSSSAEPEHIIQPDDVVEIYKGVRDLSLQRNNIQVGGYTRANGIQVEPYERTPPGGYSFNQQLKANQDALIVSCVALGIDWCYGKYEDWSKKKEQEKASKQK